MKISKEKLIIIITVFIDVLGIGIIIPILPFYVENFGVSPFGVTLLFATFSLFSFFSAPFLGSLSDKIGRRPVLLISILSTALGWFIFAGAKNVFFLFLGRIVDGLAAGNFPIAQGYLVDISKNEKERATNLGIIGAIFGVGLVVGPILGGILSEFSFSLPFYFSGILATLNFFGAYFFLPETNKKMDKTKKISKNPLSPILNSFQDKKLRTRYLVWFLFGLAVSFHQSIMALFLDAQFGFGSSAVSYVLTLMGGIILLNQGVLLSKFWLRFFSESFLELWPFLSFAIGYILMDMKNVVFFLSGLVLLGFSQSILRVIITSRVSEISSQEKRGEALGILSAIFSLAMIVAPPMAGIFFEIKIWLPFIVSAGLVLGAFGIMKYCCFEKNNNNVNYK